MITQPAGLGLPTRTALLWLGCFVAGCLAGAWHTTAPRNAHAASAPRIPLAQNPTPRSESEAPAAKFFARVHIALSFPPGDQRDHAIAEAAADLTATEARDAISRLLLLGIPERESLLAQLFSRWAEFDPPAAAASAHGLARPRERESAVRAVVSTWADANSQSAMTWVNALPEGALRSEAWNAVIVTVAGRDPAQALSCFEHLPGSTMHTRSAIMAIFESWMEKDPAAASVRAPQVPPGEARQLALLIVATGWALSDVEHAMAWAQSVPGDPQISLISSVLGTWAGRDSAAALAWLKRQPDGDQKLRLIDAFTVAKPDVKMARQLVEMIPAGMQRENANDWLLSRYPPAEAATLVLGESDPVKRRNMLGNLLPLLKGTDLRRVLAALGPTAAEAVGALPYHSDPEIFAEWMLKQPDGAHHLARIAASWIHLEPNAATAWLQSLPPPARDEALGGVINDSLSLVRRDSSFRTALSLQETERWIVQLSPGAPREAAYERLAQRWLSIDAEAARSWLRDAPLSPAAKAKLLKAGPSAE